MCFFLYIFAGLNFIKKTRKMKKIALSLVIVTGLTISVTSCKKTTETTEAGEVAETSAEAITYIVDVENSTIEWKAGTVIPGKAHNGTISISSGEVNVKEGVLEAGSFVLDMTSIAVSDLDEENGKSYLEAHLKGTNEDGSADDFFNTTQFPEGKFEITAVTNEGLDGNLTLKGITKNIKVPAKITVNNNEVTIASEPFFIDRTQWNVNFRNQSMADVAKDKVIKNDVEIQLSVKAAIAN